MTFIGVPGLADAEAMREFVDDNGATGFVHLDDADDIWDRFGVSRQSTYVYIDDDGTWRASGYGSLRADVEALIAQ